MCNGTKIFGADGSVNVLGGAGAGLVSRVQPASIGGVLAVSDYIANAINCTALTTAAMTADVLRAMPFVAPARGGVLDRIAAEVTTGVAGNIRIGLYENLADQRDVFPGALLDDSGNVSSAVAAIKSHAVARALVPGRIYWLALVGSVSITCRALTVASVSSFLGMDSTATTALNCGVSVAHTFGALPNPFTVSGAAYITAAPIPVLRYRFSA